MRGEFNAAISQLHLERNLSKEQVIASVEEAVKAVYVGQYNPDYEVEVRMNLVTGHASVYRAYEVADPVTDPERQIGVAEARKVNPQATLGQTIQIDITPKEFGRIAAQKTKQQILQKLREAEQETVLGEFAGREGELVTGVISRWEAGLLILEFGKAEGILPRAEQVETEAYRPGQRLKVLIQKVNRNPKGPQIVVSRRDRQLLRRLFEIEVPEIFNGTVEIKAIARVPGHRSKVAVAARQPGIDPVGSCVGVRGIRVQNVVDEVYGEKIDIIQWNEDPADFIARALSPAQVTSVSLDTMTKTATVIVPERQLSLAIGKDGHNARLAANLTGWRIDIRSAESLMPREEPQDEAEDAGTDRASLETATSEPTGVNGDGQAAQGRGSLGAAPVEAAEATPETART